MAMSPLCYPILEIHGYRIYNIHNNEPYALILYGKTPHSRFRIINTNVFSDSAGFRISTGARVVKNLDKRTTLVYPRP